MEKIKLIALDVDGVLTDGRLYFGEQGEMAKAFHVFDGMGISLARKAGIAIAIITGRYSSMVQKRAEELHIDYIYQGIGNKQEVLLSLCKTMDITANEVAYVGDDINDLACIELVGFGACPSNACEEVKEVADYVCPVQGGHGAVRHIIEKIMKETELWEAVLSAYRAGTVSGKQ